MNVPRILRQEDDASRFESPTSSRQGTTIPQLDLDISGSSREPRSPIVQTPDSKQWVDLDLISPKLLKEIRRQYDPSFRHETVGTLGKGAAKIKAWARQSKPGNEGHSRRKIGEGGDEVTDVRLVSPQSATEHDTLGQFNPPELSSTDNGPIELPNTPIPAELAAVPSRSYSIATSAAEHEEPPPMYEPRIQRQSVYALSIQTNWEGVNELGNASQEFSPTNHLRTSTVPQRTPSRGSMVSTPVEGLTLGNRFDEELAAENNSSSLDSEDRSPSLDSEKAEGHEDHTKVSQNDPAPDKDFSEIVESLLGSLRARKPSAASQSSILMDNTERGISVSGEHLVTSGPYEPEPNSTTSLNNQKSSRRARTAHRKARLRSKAKRGIKKAVSKEITNHHVGAHEGEQVVMEPVTSNAPTSSNSCANFQSHTTFENTADARNGTPPVRQERLSKTGGGLHPKFGLGLSSLEPMSEFSTDNYAREARVLHSVPKTAPGPKSSPATRSQSDADLLRMMLPRLDTSISVKKSPGSPASYGLGVTARNINHEEKIETAASRQRAATTTEGAPSAIANDKDSMPSPVVAIAEPPAQEFRGTNIGRVDSRQILYHPSSPRRSGLVAFGSGLLLGVTNVLIDGLATVRNLVGPEPLVAEGKVRVRWTCACGEQLYDDFIERRPGAARELEAYLNGVQLHHSSSPMSSSAASSQTARSVNSSPSGPPSSSTSWSSYGPPGSSHQQESTKGPQVSESSRAQPSCSPLYEPPWLLTCANESLSTPKVAHIDMTPLKIRSDKDLALSLREHYNLVNKKWWRPFRLRGLVTINFVQFEVHQNRFADIRKCPDMPQPGDGEYDFQPDDLLPPVGSTYLLHLFRHPEDYDGEMITYLRAPKKNGRLQHGIGWGINLVEGFLAHRVWMLLSVFFCLGSLIFAVLWIWRKHNIQSAFGVAAWMVSLAALSTKLEEESQVMQDEVWPDAGTAIVTCIGTSIEMTRRGSNLTPSPAQPPAIVANKGPPG